MKPFADALCAAPIGAALLERLEWEQHPKIPWEQPTLPDDIAIAKAADLVSALSLGELLSAAFFAAGSVGPWTPDAPESALSAYEHVERRRPIADAVAEVFGKQLHAPIDLDSQEWWVGGTAPVSDSRSPVDGPGDFTSTYGSGEFPWNAIRSVTAMPQTVHEEFVDHQEIPAPIGRWSLPIDRRRLEELPVHSIHRPSDWTRLTIEHPLEARPRQACWALPGNQTALRPDHPLFALDNQHAAVRNVGRRTQVCISAGRDG